jgi:hypothetical protein
VQALVLQVVEQPFRIRSTISRIPDLPQVHPGVHMTSSRSFLALGLSACLFACGGSSNNGAGTMGSAGADGLTIGMADGGASDCAGLMPNSVGQMVTSSMSSACPGMTGAPMPTMPMGDGMPMGNGSARGDTAMPMGMGGSMPAGTMMPMASGDTILATGTDASGLKLVLQDASSMCSGCVTGQWFDSMGMASMDSFTVLSGFNGTTLDMAQLIGGGLAIRGMNGMTSQWLATIGPGSTMPLAAPAWLAPDTSLAIVRGGRAYAIVPTSTCSASVEILSPAGNQCGQLTAPDEGASCSLSVSLDGTLVQSMLGSDSMSCMQDSWPGVLQ